MRPIVVNQHHAGDGIGSTVEVAENANEVGSDVGVADQFAQLYLPRAVDVQHFNVTQFAAWNAAPFLVALSPHACKYGIGDGVGRKAAPFTIAAHSLRRHSLTSFPAAQFLLFVVIQMNFLADELRFL